MKSRPRAQQTRALKRLTGREFAWREESTVNKISDIMAVMGLAIVFVAIAMLIACWG